MFNIVGPEGINFLGKRGVNAADAINDKDVVVYRQLRRYIDLVTGTTTSRINLLSVGTGIPIYKGLSGTTYLFRSITGGTNINITSGDTLIVNTNSAVTFSSLSATSISGNSFFSGTTPLDQIFIQNVDNVGVGPAFVYRDKSGGNAHLRSFSADTPNLFFTTGDTHGIHLNTSLILTGLTATTIQVINLSGTNISGGTFFSGTTPLDQIFIQNVDNVGVGPAFVYRDKSGGVAHLRSFSGGNATYIETGDTHVINHTLITSGQSGNKSIQILNSGSITTGNFGLTWGKNNTNQSPYSTVFGGSNNIISGNSPYSFVGGMGNTILSASSFSTILNGSGNTISGSSHSFISHGFDHRISGLTSAIIGGQNNVVPNNVRNATIIGLTGTTVEFSDRVYAPGLQISDLTGGTGLNNFVFAEPNGHLILSSLTAVQNILSGTSFTGITSAATVGFGFPVLSGVVSPTIFIRSLTATTNLNIVTGDTIIIRLNDNVSLTGLTASTITVGSISGDSFFSGSTPFTDIFLQNVDNVGVGPAFVYRDKSGGVAHLRSFAPGNAIEIVTGDTHTINHTLWTSGQTGTKSIMVLSSGSIVSGNFNLAAGQLNTNQSNYATIAGGKNNIISASSTYSFIGAGAGSIVTASTKSSIVSGNSNKIFSANNSMIGAGSSITIGSPYSFIGAGVSNIVSAGTQSSIVGGRNNKNYSDYSIIGGGRNNVIYAASTQSGIVSGRYNKTYGIYNSILGGKSNKTHGYQNVIGGGLLNKTYENQSFIGAGNNNLVSGVTSVIVGGQLNRIYRNFAFIGTGTNNLNTSYQGFIGAGTLNSATTRVRIFIGAGSSNLIDGNNAAIICGSNNQSLSSNYSLIGAGTSNLISASTSSGILVGASNKISGSTNSIIIGGSLNIISGSTSSIIAIGKNNELNNGTYSSIVGGNNNYITGSNNFIGGGDTNEVKGSGNFLGTGHANYLNGTNSSIVCGWDNYNNALRSFVGGGQFNYNRSAYSSVVGGSYNSANTGNCIFIGGGQHNIALANSSSIVGGKSNYIKHEVNAGNGGVGAFIGGGAFNSALTSYAVVVGGSGNIASGTTSFIGSGGRNKILGVTQNCGIVTGQYNLIYNILGTVKYTTISGGRFNTAKTSYSFIGNGLRNLISGGTYSSTIGGSLNKVYGTRSAIICGNSYTVTGSSIVMVPKLRIGSIVAGGTYSLSIDTNGYVFKSALAGVGEANTASNIGGDHGIFASKVGVDLRFKSLSAGTNVTITSSATEITINSTGGGSGTSSTNDNGLNTYTGGTPAFQTINVSALTIDHLTVSGATILNTLSALTVSATTFFSGSTELSTLFPTSYWTAGDLGTESIKTVGGSNYVNGNHSLVGGNLNNITSAYSSIIGGRSNKVLSAYSSIVGGKFNTISGGNAFYSFIGGGALNKISFDSSRSVIGGGVGNIIGSITNNAIYSRYGFIGGGALNVLGNNSRSWHSFIGGGYNNKIDGYRIVLVGGKNNIITGSTIYTTGVGSSLVGGRDNTIKGTYSFIGGGGGFTYSSYGNFINGDLSVIVGGKQNIVSGNTSFVGGGQGNKTYSTLTNIGGGLYNFISNASIASNISGGYKNRTYGGATFNGGGSYNWILAGSDNSSIIAGLRNKIYGKHSLIGGGYKNVINSLNFGSPYSYSTILSGKLNTGSSTYSFISNGINNIIKSGGTLNAIINSSGSTVDYNLTGVTIISLTGFTANRNHTVYIPDAVVVNLSGATTRMVVAGTDGLLSTQNFPFDVSGFRKSGTTTTGTTIERWYNSQTTAGPTASSNFISNRILTSPFIVSKQMYIDRIAFEVTVTGNSSSNCILGIYDSSNNSTPNNLIYGGTDSFTSSTLSVGVKAFSATTSLSPGLYWLAWGVQTVGTLFVRGLTSNSGIPAIVGYPSSLGQNPGLGYQHTHSWNNSLPSQFPMSAVTVAISVPAISVRSLSI